VSKQTKIISLDELERLAKEATPGPWHYTPETDSDDWTLHNDEYTFIKQDDSGVPIYDKDGEYIAAANPARVLELITAIKDIWALRGVNGPDCCDSTMAIVKKVLREE